MDLTDELRGNSPGGVRQDEQAVIICLRFPIGKLQKQKARDAVFDLDDILREVIETSGVGVYNGHEFCVGQEEESVTFYMCGEDAGKMYREVKPILQSLPGLSEFYIVKRYSQIREDLFSMNS